ncbi:MAG: universal stress protein [Gammaproteobacteria bacterium]|nr:universal stress protein [Gammaproteobacteria bacterium]MBT8443687.1 universal stress protein [Gammaproteobacteria bacterium]NND37903.1 universal stress protein [Gammaproteobacteria bacterium]
MAKTESMLIVVDPTAETHPAIERGQTVARDLGLAVELFICGYSPQLVGSALLNADRRERAKRSFLAGHKARLGQLAAPLRDVGLDVTVSAAWDHPLYEGIIRQALHCNPRIVVKDTHYHSRLERAFFTNTDWHLIRACPVPLWLIKPERSFDSPVILASVDPLHDNDKPANLDGRLLSEAFELADETGGIVHAFHGYNPFIDPDDPKRAELAHEQAMQALAEEFQLPEDRVHVRPGNAVDLLPAIANEISASLVVMGAVSRSRLEHAVVGSTAENVLDLLPCDVLIVKPKGYVSPVTFKSAPRGVIYAEDA